MQRQHCTETDRGQAFTLEALFASLLLLTAILFALQTSAITPLTGSTASQQVQNQQAAISEGTLSIGHEQGLLKDAVLYYNYNQYEFYGLEDSQMRQSYSSPSELSYDGDNDAFGNLLEKSFRGGWGVATNVNVHYFDSPSQPSLQTQQVVNMGAPSSNAVSASRTFVLYDDDELLNADGSASGSTIGETGTLHYIDDIYDSSPVYNVVTVEVVVWRI